MKSEKLTVKQKADLKKFVEIAYINKKLWLSKEGFPTFLPLSTPEYFGDKISLLNSILINYPTIRKEEDVNDDFKVKEMRWILQIITDDERFEGFKRPGLPPETPYFTMKFKQADKIYEEISYIENSDELDTQSLLDTLDKILEDLKSNNFVTQYWDSK